MALTAKKISELTPIIRHLARQFEQAGKRVALDVEDLEQEAWIVADRVDKRRPENLKQCVSRAVKNRFIDLIENPDPVEDIADRDFEDRQPAEENGGKLESIIGAALLDLPARQHQIVRLYFGIGCARHSLRQAAEVVDVGRDTIQRELKAAMAIIGRHPVLIGEWHRVSLHE